jgi:hypothetical protein
MMRAEKIAEDVGGALDHQRREPAGADAGEPGAPVERAATSPPTSWSRDRGDRPRAAALEEAGQVLRQPSAIGVQPEEA